MVSKPFIDQIFLLCRNALVNSPLQTDNRKAGFIDDKSGASKQAPEDQQLAKQVKPYQLHQPIDSIAQPRSQYPSVGFDDW